MEASESNSLVPSNLLATFLAGKRREQLTQYNLGAQTSLKPTALTLLPSRHRESTTSTVHAPALAGNMLICILLLCTSHDIQMIYMIVSHDIQK